MFEWKEAYSVNIPSVDEQHRKLFAIANEMDELLNNNLIIDKYDQIVAIIDELKNYTIEHFANEEAHMLQLKYPKFLSHKALHNDFVEKISAIDYTQIDNEQNHYLKKNPGLCC